MAKEMRWTLPTEVYPAKTRCYLIQIPDERFYVGAFLGAIYNLTLSNNWQRDPDHTAALVSRVWTTIFDGLVAGGCEVPPIILQDTFTGEELMASLCESLRFQNGVLQAFCCGEWVDIPGAGSAPGSGVEQPTGDGPLAPGACATYNAVLDGNGKWLLPVPVNANDVITISTVSGAWNDGTIDWNCPNGDNYILGVCNGTPEASLTGDPVPLAPHMALVALIGATVPVWQYAYNTTFTVPAGVTDANVTFQANDSDLTDNSGRISFTVSICASSEGTASGTDSSDFTIDDQGWVIRTGHAGSYSAGVGFLSGCDQPGLDTYNQIVIEKTVVHAARIVSITTTFNRVYSGFNDGALGALAAKNFVEGGGGTAIGSDASMASGTGTQVVFNANPVDVIPGDVITVIVADGYLYHRGDCSSLSGGSVTEYQIDVAWTGANPF